MARFGKDMNTHKLFSIQFVVNLDENHIMRKVALTQPILFADTVTAVNLLVLILF